jgi:hypothetical protein
MDRPRLELSLIVLLLAGVGGALSAGRGEAAKSTGPCTKIAGAELKACRFDTKDEVWLANARCENLATKDAVKACRQQAKADQKDAQQSCGEEHAARLQVCADIGVAAYRPVIDPMKFTSNVTNQFFPLPVGTTYVFESTVEHDEVTVTSDTRTIIGVPCRVVHDVVTDKQSGHVIEDTLDFYAQDDVGNVWYMGEESKQLDNGALIGIEGSWQAGRDDAQPGIIMEATPAINDEYRQEFAPPDAEDLAKVVSLTASETVPFNSYTNSLVETDEFSPLEPGVIEHKFYAAGVGNILVIEDGGVRLELVSVTP